MKKRWLAFAAACVMALSLAGCAGENAPEPEETSYAPYALSLAEFPVQAQYPREEDYYGENGKWDDEAYNAAYDAWDADRPKVMLTEEEAGAVPDFFARSAPVLVPAGDENFVYSPVNVWLALSMLAEVTDGDTRAQILGALGAENIETLRAAAADIWHASYLDDGVSSDIPANSLWLSDGMTYCRETLDLLAENYYASVFSGTPGDPDYDAALQAWLNEQTRGLLEEHASGVSMDPEVILALASTIYFKSNWSEQFYEETNTEETFHAPSGDQTAVFMHQIEYMSYLEEDGFRAAGMPMIDGSTMWFFLPDEDTDARTLLTDGSAAAILSPGAMDGTASCRNARLDISLPKFDVDADLDLISGMRALGITDVFDPAVSDFGPLTDDADGIILSSAEHAARVKIDEEGVEAAAYTVMMTGATGIIEEEPIDFTLDRPFVFAVTNRAGVVLFAGLVNTVE